MFVVFCVGSGLLRRADHSCLEDSYRVCLIACDVGTSRMWKPRPDVGCCATKEEIVTVDSAAFCSAPTRPPP